MFDVSERSGKYLGSYRLKKRFEVEGDLDTIFNLHMYLPANGIYEIYECSVKVDGREDRFIATNEKKCISFEFRVSDFDKIFDRYSRR